MKNAAFPDQIGGCEKSMHYPDDPEFILFPLGNNGGPATGLDLPEMPSVPLEKPGVVGTTDITTTYLSGLKELLDPFPEAKPRAAEIQSPFDLIARRFGERPEYRILWERAENGPVAVISPDGQGLSFLIPPGENWTTREIAQTVGEYLTLVRRTNGTVVAPHGVQPLKLGEAQHISVVGDSLEMSCQAGYIDLLLGWWEPGIIAHQGNGPYGDAYLTLAYLLEALGARQS